MKRAVAMILAGGKGSRMDILCRDRAKPIVPFAGMHRVIDFTLSNCLQSDITEVGVLVDFERSQVIEYLDSLPAGGPDWDLAALQPRNGGYKGTADAVYQNLDFVRKSGAEAVVILAGDHVYRMDYRDMLGFHFDSGADVTVGVVRVPLSETHRFGMVVADEGGRITQFVEKPRVPAGDLASMGIYVFKPEVLARRLAEDASSHGSAHDFGRSVLPAMVGRDRSYVHRFSGYWQDIGTVTAYHEANIGMTHHAPPFSLEGVWPASSGEHSFSRIEQFGDNIRHSLVSPGCVIEGRVENSVLSPGVRVEARAVVRNSVVMSNSVVGWQSVVDHCVVDEDVVIGKSCYVGFMKGYGPSGAGITMIGRGARIPDFTAIDRNCKVLPKVGTEDFVTNCVPSGTVVQPKAIAAIA